MKTGFIGFLLMAIGAGMSHPTDNDVSSWWILAGVGLGVIIGRIAGSVMSPSP